MGAPQKSKPLHDDVSKPNGEYDPAKLERKLAEIDTAIRRANLRRKAYQDAGDDRSAAIEEAVIDRRLRERKQVTS